MDVTAEMHKWHDMILGSPPRPRKMEVSRSVIEAFSGIATKRVGLPGVIDCLYGCPVVPDDSLPPGAWRILDSDGNMMHEGRIDDGDDAKS